MRKSEVIPKKMVEFDTCEPTQNMIRRAGYYRARKAGFPPPGKIVAKFGVGDIKSLSCFAPPPRKILEMNIKKLMFGFASWSLILFRRASWFS
jgi:hypothetical protein